MPCSNMKEKIHYSHVCVKAAWSYENKTSDPLESGIYCDFPTKQLSKNCLVSMLLRLPPTFDILRRVTAGGCRWVKTLQHSCLPCHSCFVILVVTHPFPSLGYLKGTCATNGTEKSEDFFMVNCVVSVKYENISVHSLLCRIKFWLFRPFLWLFYSPPSPQSLSS